MAFLRANRLDPLTSLLLVIDMQEKLLSAIPNSTGLCAAAGRLMDGAAIFDVPVLVTEQNPQGIGTTTKSLSRHLAERRIPVCEKTAFSVCCDDTIRRRLRELDRNQVVMAGIEAHVCVQQSVLDLRAMDYEVYVCADAVSSRRDRDYLVALDRMRQEGAYIMTVESALFEWCHESGTDRFRRMLPIIKSAAK